MSINRVVLVGRLVRDPEMKVTSTGKNVCDFTIAVDKKFKPQDGSPTADFFRCTAWEKTAEFVGNYLNKGRLIAVEGRLSSRKYQDKDGNNREVVEIVADNVQSLERPRDDDSSGGGGGEASANGSGYKAPARAAVQAAPVPTEEEYDPFADE